MPDISWEQIWGVVITTTVAALIRIIFVFLKEQREKHIQEEEQKDRMINELIKTNQELIGWKDSIDKRNKLIEEQLNRMTAQITLITHNDLILMKDKIIQLCQAYIKKGSIPVSARENLIEMYKCYHEMGGNGTCQLVYEYTMKLKITETDFTTDITKDSDPNDRPKRRKKTQLITTTEIL